MPNLTGPHLIIILVIVLLLFGAPKLPGLAKSIGQSMRIFRGEVKNMKKDDEVDVPPATDVYSQPAASNAPAAPQAPASPQAPVTPPVQNSAPAAPAPEAPAAPSSDARGNTGTSN
ncbi:twin-arginine translocase TatA/TatE family subunit [Pseudoclavibacter sp. AY1F1]|uniref:Sec-independent protein translocase subunit TatA n=1 Tax=Pseudoclavibacter sp. AY1F1 TaxID=2080583 RepID=UPI000CE7C3C3|nr:Sec-independent protein translocase subunit TatA [Pseudoclavibacter sp. AY1F1]PPF47444.1 twin-arginine translocase TatA/TatE family subunit [Pseudoclavibacter sp. AY1F1]